MGPAVEGLIIEGKGRAQSDLVSRVPLHGHCQDPVPWASGVAGQGNNASWEHWLGVGSL